MYSVRIKNVGDTTAYYVHNDKVKLSSGKVVKGINTIDSFSFEMSPLHPCFNLIHDFTTTIEVKNENRNRVEFSGRVLYTNDDMSESGEIKKEVVCESCLGYLCDSEQEPMSERTWTVEDFLKRVVRVHNSQVESYKKINLVGHSPEIGAATLRCAIQRENTWETIKKNLLDSLGYELIYSDTSDNGFAIEIVKDEKNVSETKIELSRNMKSISRERDPSEIVTRLIPLGAKNEETGEQLNITSVNNGVNYIEDSEARELYGIRYKSVEFNDVTTALKLMESGDEWLKANNKVRVKYTVTALDLSLLGLEIDDFDVRNYHPLVNPLLSINDDARIIKKNIDVCEEVKSSFEIGDNFETVSDIQIRRAKELSTIGDSLASDYESLEQQISDTENLLYEEISRAEGVEASLKVENAEILAKVENTEGYLAQFQISLNEITASVSNHEDSISELTIELNKISASVSNGVTSADLALEIGEDGIARISASADKIHFDSGEITISSDNFTLDESGNVDITGSFCSASGSRSTYIRSGYIEADSNDGNTRIFGGNISISSFGYELLLGGNGLTCGGNSIVFDGSGGWLSGTWYGTSSQAITSDANKKHEIEDLNAPYSALFDSLTPRLYKYNDGTSNRVHVGFIAQEVEAAINAAGLTTQDFAGFVRTQRTNEEGEVLEEVCCLRYEEFIALCVNEIQALKKEIGELKNNG